MTRIRYKDLSKEEQQELLKKFFIAIVSLESYEEVSNFFKDLLQADETIMLARRLKIADMLEDGYTYEEIANRMDVGFDTISRVNQWLQYGSGGYKVAIKRLRKIEKRENEKRIRKAYRQLKELEPFSWSWIKKRYPTIDLDNIKDMIDDLQKAYRKIKRKRSLKNN